MWRRLVSSQLKTLATASASASASTSATTVAATACRSARFLSTHRSSVSLFNRAFSTDSANGVVKKKVEDVKPVATGYEPEVVKKKVEDVMPIATGHEREELEAELEGRDILEIDHPVGPFGTKEEPAVVKSYYDKRIVGCPGGEGEDEHDVVWFWLEKGKPHECPVCSQYFELEVVGPGGPPDGHGDDDEDEHHH